MARKTRAQIERGEQIYQLTTLVAGEFSLQEVLDKLAEAAVQIVGVKACSIRLLDEQTDDLKMRSTYGLSEEYRNKGVVSRDDPVVKAAFAGDAVVLDDMRVDGRVKYRDATLEEGLVSQLTVAMIFRNQAIGVLRLYSPRPKHFDDDDINLARAVASQCAVAITNAKLYAQAIQGARVKEQMRLAGIIQRRMIPEKAPPLQGVDVAAAYVPCFDVGGDFYDFLQIAPNRLVIAIADVIGKGLPAAIMMSWFRGIVRAYTDSIRQVLWADDHVKISHDSSDKTSARILSAIRNFNELACLECRDGEFITLFYAAIDTQNMTMTYCSCGHEPTILIRDDQTTDLKAGGLVLGVDSNAEYDVDTIELRNNDCLLFYTDGLIDAADFDGRLWGRERMLEAVRNSAAGSSGHMIKNILRYRRRFTGLARQVDDTSMIVVKVGPGAQAG